MWAIWSFICISRDLQQQGGLCSIVISKIMVLVLLISFLLTRKATSLKVSSVDIVGTKSDFLFGLRFGGMSFIMYSEMWTNVAKYRVEAKENFCFGLVHKFTKTSSTNIYPIRT